MFFVLNDLKLVFVPDKKAACFLFKEKLFCKIALKQN